MSIGSESRRVMIRMIQRSIILTALTHKVAWLGDAQLMSSTRLPPGEKTNASHRLWCLTPIPLRRWGVIGWSG